MNRRKTLEERGPLNVAFLNTSLPVGGAETLLLNLMRRLDRQRIRPQVVCLKEPGPLGEVMQAEFPLHANLIRHRRDVAVLGRLRTLLRDEKIDAVITVGAGDKMFWGRLAARTVGVPVILSALHSTGWPDGVGFANRLLTGLTDAFIAVARSHGSFLTDFEKFPARKVVVIPNGIDTDRFVFSADDRQRLRQQWNWSAQTPVVGVVAALRPEKNLTLFLEAAAAVNQKLPTARFVLVGSGPEEAKLRAKAKELGITANVQFLGSRPDIPQLLSALDVFALSSDNEASPVSILEAMSTGLPVVCTDVGSVKESVLENQTGFIVPVGAVEPMANAWLTLLNNPAQAKVFGQNARQHVVAHNSLDSMTAAYMNLIESIYQAKAKGQVDWSTLATRPSTAAIPG